MKTQPPSNQTYIPGALHFRRKREVDHISTTIRTNTKSQIAQCALCYRKARSLRIPSMLNHRLFEKYSSSQNYYYMKDINAIVTDSRSAAAIEYKDLLDLMSDDEERLRRVYYSSEYDGKIEQLGEYYKYHKEIPRIFAKEQYDLYFDYHDKKRRLEYLRITEMLKKNSPEYESEEPQSRITENYSPMLKDLSSYIKKTDQSSTLVDMVSKLGNIVSGTPNSTSFSLNQTVEGLKTPEEQKSLFKKKPRGKFTFLKRNENPEDKSLKRKDSGSAIAETLDEFGLKNEWFRKFKHEAAKKSSEKEKTFLERHFLEKKEIKLDLKGKKSTRFKKSTKTTNVQSSRPEKTDHQPLTQKLRNATFNWTKLDKNFLGDKFEKKAKKSSRNHYKPSLRDSEEPLSSKREKSSSQKKYVSSLKDAKKYRAKKRHQKTKSEFTKGIMNRIDSRNLTGSSGNFQFLIRRKSGDKESNGVRRVLERSKDKLKKLHFESVHSARVDHNINAQEYNLFRKNRGSKNSLGTKRKKEVNTGRKKTRMSSLNDFKFLRTDRKQGLSHRNKSGVGSKSRLKHKYTKSEPESLKLHKMKKKLITEEKKAGHSRRDSQNISSQRSYKFGAKFQGFVNLKGNRSKR